MLKKFEILTLEAGLVMINYLEKRRNPPVATA